MSRSLYYIVMKVTDIFFQCTLLAARSHHVSVVGICQFYIIFSAHCWGGCSAWNLAAFAKIMKKYDKAAKHRVGLFYIKEVEHSHFASSDVVHVKFSLPMDLLSH